MGKSSESQDFVIVKIAGLKLYFELTQVKCERYQQSSFLICPFNHSNVSHLVMFASYIFYSSHMCCLHVSEFILRFYLLCFCRVFFPPQLLVNLQPLCYFSSGIVIVFFFSFSFLRCEEYSLYSLCWNNEAAGETDLYQIIYFIT